MSTASQPRSVTELNIANNVPGWHWVRMRNLRKDGRRLTRKLRRAQKEYDNIRKRFQIAEHRALWTALGVSLVSIGLTGIVSLEVGAAIANHPLHDSQLPANVCAALLALGTVFLGHVLFALAAVRTLKRDLLALTAQGIALRQELWKMSAGGEDEIAAMQSKINDWIVKVAKRLAEDDYSKAAHFRNDAGQMLLVMLYGNEGIQGLEVQLETRLTRLGEIMEPARL